MRCMLTSNVSVENRFANGSQGRLLQWQPEKTEKKAFLASHPDLQARFLKEGSMKKQTFLADVDFIDCSIRPESLTAVPGAPTMLQLPLLASYALTIHKTQATVHGLSIASPLPLPPSPALLFRTCCLNRQLALDQTYCSRCSRRCLRTGASLCPCIESDRSAEFRTTWHTTLGSS